jgi:hypothetical protein
MPRPPPFDSGSMAKATPEVLERAGALGVASPEVLERAREQVSLGERDPN